MPTYEIVYAATDDGESSDGGEEELAHRLSPSDGFTSPSSSNFVPHVPNVIVPDPTLQQQTEAAAVSKAREASKERRSTSRSSTERVPGRYVAASSRIAAAYSPGGVDSLSSSGPDNSAVAVTSFDPSASAAGPRSFYSSQPGLHHTYSQSSSAAESQTPPLRTLPSSRGRTASVYSDAPPAYTPSPTSPLSPNSQQDQDHNRTYSTFTPIMGRPGPDVVEQEGLLAREPESMADYPGGDEESLMPSWRRRVRRQLPPWLNYKIVLVSLALMGISAGFLANAFRGIRGGQVSNDDGYIYIKVNC